MRLLDLFCGEGLAALGYWNSGRFSEIVGVDIRHELQRSYSFDFIHGDCLKLDYEFLSQFDFIHASPPCQYYSKITPDRSKHMRLIPAIKQMLFASGKPHIIENVEGSQYDLRPNMVISGNYLGLPMVRKRYFFVSELDDLHLRFIKDATGDNISLHGGDYISRDEACKAFGLSDINTLQLSKITIHGIEQGIPPRMTEFLARTLIAAPVFI